MKNRKTQITGIILSTIMLASCGSEGTNSPANIEADTTTVSTTTIATTTAPVTTTAPPIADQITLNDKAVEAYKTIKNFIADNSNSKPVPTSGIVRFDTKTEDIGDYAELNNLLAEKIGDYSLVEYMLDGKNNITYVKVWDNRKTSGECGECRLRNVAVDGYLFVINYIKENRKTNEKTIPTSKIIKFNTNEALNTDYSEINKLITEKIGKNYTVEYEVTEKNQVQYVKLWNENDNEGECGECTREDFLELVDIAINAVQVSQEEGNKVFDVLSKTNIKYGLNGSYEYVLNKMFSSYESVVIKHYYEHDDYELIFWGETPRDRYKYTITIKGQYQMFPHSNIKYNGELVLIVDISNGTSVKTLKDKDGILGFAEAWLVLD